MREAPVIVEIVHGSAAYRAVLEWRDRVLRRPLGRVLTDEDTAGEDRQRHFVLQEGDELLAGVIAATGESATAVRLRQMWVRDDRAGSGLGRLLLQGVERLLREEGVECLSLHARVVVRGFYESCGYMARGPEFEEIGIPHVRMTRRIGSETKESSGLSHDPMRP